MEAQLAEATRRLSPAEYLAAERVALHKSEYRDGVVYPMEGHNGEVRGMAGGRSPHSRIAANLITALGRRLDDSPCNAYTSDMLVHPSSTEFFYPDVGLACGEEQFYEDSDDCLLNPCLLAEVLSRSTHKNDREKFFHYQQIPSLNDFLLIHQDCAYIEHFARAASGEWIYKLVGHPHDPKIGLQATLKLDSLGLEIPLREIYRRIKLNFLPLHLK